MESVASSNPTPEGFYVVNTRDISVQKARERELKESNRSLDEFAHLVSHDLRNPLQVARGRLELAQEDCDSGHLDAVESAHARMQALIEDVLEAARGDTNPELAAVDLRSIAEDAWRNVDTGDAVLKPPDSVEVYADGSRLQRLLENLYRNSVAQREDVTVSVEVLDDGFYVEDDGPGIPEAEQEKVFEPGYSDSDDGGGFGLKIVEQVVSAHDWEVDVDRGDTGGARFEFSAVEFVE